ncbi:hypothetical protein E2C01_070467 [Portunus trituberculatus]|uniref:RRM domain-containing protein n=1 Tax=Portunus trituberculatus TaxID=210409 RepID=A0A5B7I268_PORTR|nr:hypothetical protein [Portunus trituberculatus]
MLVRSPVRDHTNWFLRRLPLDQRTHPLEGSPNRGLPVLYGWVSRLGCFEREVSALPLTNILHHVGPFFLNDWSAWGRGTPSTAASAHSHCCPSSREVADLAHETSPSGLSKKEDSPPQGPPTAVSFSGSSFERRISAEYDSFLMVNVNPSFSYHALHSLLKVYGTVLRIRLVYDKDFPSNRCYVTFLSCDEARLAYKHVTSLPLAGSGFKTEFIQSRNVSDSDMYYIPNVF